MARSLFGLVGLGATLIFALPAAMLGLEYLLFRGRPTAGVALVVIAALMVLVEEHITTPMDLPTMVADRTLGKLAKASEDDEE
jgi:hypothetical protein